MTIRIASLGMYDHPAVAAANDGLWAGIAARLRDAGLDAVPERLERSRPLDEIWADPRLLLAQTCGYPLMTAWQDRLRYVATPVYRAPGCKDVLHRSHLVVRRDDPAGSVADLRGRRAALNDWGSNTGMNLFRAAIAPHAQGKPFFADILTTGSHLESARAVAAGDADIASIDAVTFAHLVRHEPDIVAGLRTLAWSDPIAGLPLVTTASTSADVIDLLRRTLDEVARADDLADARASLLIDGFTMLDPDGYHAIPELERRAIRAGYPRLA